MNYSVCIFKDFRIGITNSWIPVSAVLGVVFLIHELFLDLQQDRLHFCKHKPYHLVALEEKRIYDGIFRGTGEVNPYEIRQQLTDTLNDKAMDWMLFYFECIQLPIHL